MRVYELAKEYEYKATVFLDIIQEFGVNVNSHMSGLSTDQVDLIKDKMDTKDVEVVTEIKSQRNVHFLDNLNVLGQPLPAEGEDSSLETVTVELDEQLNPVDEMEDGEEEIDTELSFGQQAFAKAKELENDEDVVETQEVIVERPVGFFSWIKGLFS